METAVAGIIILLLTGRTHGEAGHGGFYPIVGDIMDDGETRAAVGAVDERIMKAAILGIKELIQAILTDGDIW
jgi:hypothetical protein